MIVGTAGHIDHGKSSLVRALTGVEPDRLKEEKARGISIDLGFAYAQTGAGTIGFVDVPGHEKFVHNMLAGAGGIDFVMLVVAADDGVMPQTREHLAIVDLLGVTQGLVALSKADLVAPERIAEAEAEVAALLAPTALAGAPILPVSTLTGEGLEAIRARLGEAMRQPGSRRADGRFRLAVDRSFTLQGAGTVVTGTVLSGRIDLGAEVLVSPSGRRARVRSIHAQNREAQEGRAGDRCALNLAGDAIRKDAVARGDVVLDAALHAPTDRIDAHLKVLASEPRAIAQWMPVRLHHAAAEIGGRIVLLGGDRIAPGGDGLVQIVLERPVAAAVGDRFVIRDTSAQRTVGGGRFLDLRPPTRKRGAPERLAQLAAHAKADQAEALGALLDIAPHHVDLTGFARDRALSEAELEAVAQRVGLIRIATANSVIAVSAATAVKLKRTILAALDSYHLQNPDLAGIGRERLRLSIEPRLPAPAFAALLQGLVRTGEVALDGSWVKLPSHAVRMTPHDEDLWEAIHPLIAGTERFRPPRVRDIAETIDAGEQDVRRIFKLQSRLGRVDEVAHDHFFLRETVAEMVGIALDIARGAPKGEFTAAQLRDRLDNGRKVAIQILEFFDRHGVTLRRGDVRRINKHRLDLFGSLLEESAGSGPDPGRASSPVGRPDFKSGRGREPVSGGFDSHSLPPDLGTMNR